MKEKFIFIINPKAGKNNNAVLFIDKIKAAIQTFKLDAEIYITKSVGDARDYVKKRCENLKMPTRFYACGGDGTLNEVINGAAECEDATVGVLPLGSGNDYIKSLGNYDFLNLKSQIFGEVKPIDLIKVQGRYIANMCNIGFDASVGHNFVKFKSIPGFTGNVAYMSSVFYTLMSKLGNQMQIILDDQTVIKDNFLLCSISKGIYCGGQFRTAPRANPFDGYMDVCPIKLISRPKFLKFVSFYKNGTHFEEPGIKDVCAYYKCKKVTIKNAQNIPASFDGEVAFLNGDVTFELIPKALKFVLPIVTDQTEKEIRKEIAEVF